MIDSLLPHAAPEPKSQIARHRTEPEASFSEWLEARPIEKELAWDHVTGAVGAAPAEHQLRGQGGSVFLPWGLIANGSLSHCEAIIAMGSRGISPSGSPAALRSSPPEHSAGLVAPSPALLQPAAVPAGTRGELGRQALPSTAVQNSDTGGPLRAAPVSAAMDWLERLVRWLEQSGQGPVLWIRDYRLGDTETQQLVDTLRLSAQEQGIHLERVVINGKELWSTKAATQQPRTGDAS